MNMKDKKKISPLQALNDALKTEKEAAEMAIGANFVAVTPDTENTHTRKDDKHYIEWERWVDPYGDNWKQEEWPGAFSPDGSDTEFDEENIDDDDPGFELGRHLRIMTTPLGLIPLTEQSRPSTVFNFWKGTTNFRITNQMVALLNDTDGVEILNVFTRYRFRIGIGKLFQDRKVMDSISEKIDAYLEHKEKPTCPLKLSGEMYRKKAN